MEIDFKQKLKKKIQEEKELYFRKHYQLLYLRYLLCLRKVVKRMKSSDSKETD